jgi:hypothetical protein
MSLDLKLWGQRIDNIFSMHSGYLDSAWKHCCDVLYIDDTFLTGKYEVTMLIAIGIDANCQLVHLAFAIVEKENNDS